MQPLFFGSIFMCVCLLSLLQVTFQHALPSQFSEVAQGLLTVGFLESRVGNCHDLHVDLSWQEFLASPDCCGIGESCAYECEVSKEVLDVADVQEVVPVVADVR